MNVPIFIELAKVDEKTCSEYQFSSLGIKYIISALFHECNVDTL